MTLIHVTASGDRLCILTAAWYALVGITTNYLSRSTTDGPLGHFQLGANGIVASHF